MQGTEVPALLLATIDPEPKTVAAARIRDDREPATSCTLDAPPLRYAVASMQHWLDLNA